MDTLQRIEEGHKQVHEHSQVEGDAAPERHVPGAPVQDGLSWKTQDLSKLAQAIVAADRKLQRPPILTMQYTKHSL